MSRIPEGLANALRGIAERLEAAPARAKEKADENLANLSTIRVVATDIFVAQWLTSATADAAREIRIALEVWSKPLPRARRRR